jgi:hypothetical protein
MQALINGKPLAVAITAEDVVSLAGVSTRDGSSQQFAVEAVTKGFPVITTDHSLIHEGIAYVFDTIVTVDGSWAMSFHTPAEGYVHWKPSSIAAAGGPLTVELREGQTFTGGSAATPRNCNRAIANPDSSTMVCKTGVTLTGDTAPYIAQLLIPSATSGSQKLGASTEAAEEKVLDQDTDYVLVLTETATGTVLCGINTFWYEETGA